MTHNYPIPAEALKQSIAFVGRTGSGKSFAAKGGVEQLLRAGARVCIIDPTSVWHGLRSSADGKSPGFPVVVFGGDHADAEIGEASGAPLATLLAGRNLPAIVDVSDFTMGGRTRFMTAFLEELYRAKGADRAPLTLVIDEADMFAPQRAMPDQTVMLSRMEQICRRGRVRGFRPWLITQRPATLHKDVLSQANTLVALQLTAPQDRDAIGAWIEGQADRNEGKRVLADLPKLKKGEAWVWSPSHELLERVRFPAITTFDSGRSPEEGEAAEPTTLADVDLSAIGDSLRKAEIERADNDPKALRARIKELEAALDKPRGGDLVAALHERHEGFAEGAAAGKALARRAANDLNRIAREADALCTQLSIAINEQPSPAIDADKSARADRLNEQVGIVEANHATKATISETKPRFNATARPVRATSGTSDASLSRAERLILTALAQYPQGRSSVQVALLTSYAHNGGGFRNAVGSLRTKGYAAGTNEHLTATTEGLKALGHYDRLPTGAQLLQHWYSQLSKAERKILESLAEVYPRSLTPPQIANRAGYEANGGGFRNALGRLRTLELAHGRAEIKASRDLFE